MKRGLLESAPIYFDYFPLFQLATGMFEKAPTSNKSAR